MRELDERGSAQNRAIVMKRCYRASGTMKTVGLGITHVGCSTFLTASFPPFSHLLPQTVRHGFPYQPSSMAFDPVQKILAVGTQSGALRLYPFFGVEAVALFTAARGGFR